MSNHWIMKWHETVSVGIRVKTPNPANIQRKSSAGHFFHGLLGCSWLHQIGNKSPASLYTSSERTLNEMWEISLCVRACVRLSLCVRAQRLNLTFQVFLGSSVVLENAESVWFVCARHTGAKFWTWILPLCFSAVEHICWIGKCDGCPDLNVNPQLALTPTSPPPPGHTQTVHCLRASRRPYLAPRLLFSERVEKPTG